MSDATSWHELSGTGSFGTPMTIGTLLRQVPSAAWDVLALALLLLVPGWWYSSRWLGLFPLVEFRQQAEFNLSLLWVWDQIRLAGTTTVTQWSVALLFNSELGQFCDTNILCYNATLLVVNLITAALIYCLCRLLIQYRWLAIMATSIWLVGVPVLDSMSWQATNLDKLATLLVVLGLNVGWFVFRRPFTGWRCITANLVLLAVVVLAYNCKPTAWVLLPSLVLLVFIKGPQVPIEWLLNLVAPAVYGIAQMAHVLTVLSNDPFYTEHVSSGNILVNAHAYLGYLTGSTTATLWSIPIVLAIVATVAFGLVRRTEHSLIAAWLLVCFTGTTVISLRAQYDPAFYMLLPSAYFALAAAAAIVVGLELSVGTWKAVPILASAVLALAFFSNVAESRHGYDLGEQQSKNFRESLSPIAAHVPRDPSQGLILVVDDTNYLAYRYAPEKVEKYIYGDETAFDASISEVTASKFAADFDRTSATYATFDNVMQLRAIAVRGDVVWQAN